MQSKAKTKKVKPFKAGTAKQCKAKAKPSKAKHLIQKQGIAKFEHAKQSKGKQTNLTYSMIEDNVQMADSISQGCTGLI